MLVLHTLTNTYIDTTAQHQFLQRYHQPLLESDSLGCVGTLRQFLMESVIENCENSDPREAQLLVAVMDAGDVNKMLHYAERICMLAHPGAEDVSDTLFGEWTLDSKILVEPTLREMQLEDWGEDPDFHKREWKHEVTDNNTTLGYWEWVESQREQEDDK